MSFVIHAALDESPCDECFINKLDRISNAWPVWFHTMMRGSKIKFLSLGCACETLPTEMGCNSHYAG